jgi:hypothetical protein
MIGKKILTEYSVEILSANTGVKASRLDLGMHLHRNLFLNNVAVLTRSAGHYSASSIRSISKHGRIIWPLLDCLPPYEGLLPRVCSQPCDTREKN